MNLIEELRWRGMVQDIMPNTEEFLLREKTNGYIGFDPTADSLHIGSLVPIILLMHLQQAGHTPIAVVGGATGMVGDPTGKTEARKHLCEQELQHNLAGIRKQLEKFLDFSSPISNKAKMLNNYDWFKGKNFLDFIVDAGKHLTINYMLSKDSVKSRQESTQGITFMEFCYQLIQGYDYYHLYTNENCKLQMGGSDQWGNITTGAELIRKKAGGEVFAFTCPLIRKSDGKKFGKSDQGNIWLSVDKTSPYQFYQFWLNTSDEDVASWIKIFTFLSKEEIEHAILQHGKAPQERLLQKMLAKELTILTHSKEEYENAVLTSNILFGNATIEGLKQLSEKNFLNGLIGVPSSKISKTEIETGIDIVSFLVQMKVLHSKGEARKIIQNNAIGINKQKINDIQACITIEHLLHNKYVLIQKGKKEYFLIEVV
ncbi:MAG: tyrosine--tRNA ligase [Chitinophagaceae bacterium]